MAGLKWFGWAGAFLYALCTLFYYLQQGKMPGIAGVSIGPFLLFSMPGQQHDKKPCCDDCKNGTGPCAGESH